MHKKKVMKNGLLGIKKCGEKRYFYLKFSFCGIWLNIAWNWLAFPVAHALWHRVVSGKPTSRRRSLEYSRFDDAAEADLEAGTRRPSTEQQGIEEPSTFLFFRLISYCRFHPKMFCLGFTFPPVSGLITLGSLFADGSQYRKPEAFVSFHPFHFIQMRSRIRDQGSVGKYSHSYLGASSEDHRRLFSNRIRALLCWPSDRKHYRRQGSLHA